MAGDCGDGGAQPQLLVRRMEQAYTGLAGDRYLYEGPIGDFQAELELDAEGLVRHYPSLYTAGLKHCIASSAWRRHTRGTDPE